MSRDAAARMDATGSSGRREPNEPMLVRVCACEDADVSTIARAPIATLRRIIVVTRAGVDRLEVSRMAHRALTRPYGWTGRHDFLSGESHGGRQPPAYVPRPRGRTRPGGFLFFYHFF